MPQHFGDEQGTGRSSVEPATPVLSGLRGPGVGTRAEQLALALENRIRERSLGPGDPVGTLDSLRAQTGFAYSTVSEAVRLLRDRGVLEVRPGRGGGLFVAESGPVVRLRRTLLSVADEPTTVADAVELRDHLEVLVDIGAARCRTDDDLADLRAALARMGTAAGWEPFVRANWALHERIARITPNRMAAAVYTGTLGHLRGTTPRFADGDPAFARYRAERHRVHVDLVEAIAARDETAVRAVVSRHNAAG